MSKEAIQEFYNYVQSQPEIQQQLDALIDNREVLLDKAVELGQQNNYRFSKEELETAIAELNATYGEGTELSDEQLEAIAGGKIGGFQNVGKAAYNAMRQWF